MRDARELRREAFCAGALEAAAFIAGTIAFGLIVQGCYRDQVIDPATYVENVQRVCGECDRVCNNPHTEATAGSPLILDLEGDDSPEPEVPANGPLPYLLGRLHRAVGGVMNLVLAIFPGIDVLGLGFERAGWCVVRGPDVIFGGDIRDFHPPVGVFDGVIGGDPCQSHSALSNLVRAKGLEPSFPDMTPEYERIVNEARPAWFLRENVPRAPDVKPAGYDVRSFVLDHSTLDSGDGTGHEQMRKRRFWFGVRDGQAPELRQWIKFATYVLPDRALTVNTAHDHLDGIDGIERYRARAMCGDARSVPVALGGSGKPKLSRVPAASCDGRQGHRIPDGTGQFRAASDTGRHPGEIGVTGGHAGHPPRYSLAEMLELQGLPGDFLDRAPWTTQGKRKAIGNAVPLGMAEALGRAVREAMK